MSMAAQDTEGPEQDTNPQDEHRRRVAAHRAQQRRAVVVLGDAKALGLQIARQQLGDLDLVVEYGDVGFCVQAALQW